MGMIKFDVRDFGRRDSVVSAYDDIAHQVPSSKLTLSYLEAGR
jgi:hypothetical protein